MANVKFVNAAGKYQDDTARYDLIHYMTQRKKIPNHIVGFSHGDISNAADRMTQTARSFGKDQGVRIYHFIITFAPGDVNGMEYILYAANEITRLLGQRHETAYAVHEDTRIPHIHFILRIFILVMAAFSIAWNSSNVGSTSRLFFIIILTRRTFPDWKINALSLFS